MILQSHIEVKGVSSVPKSNSYESAATCTQEMADMNNSEWGNLRSSDRCQDQRTKRKKEILTFNDRPLSSCILRTKYRLESLTVSTTTPGYSFTGAWANSSPAGPQRIESKVLRWKRQHMQYFRSPVSQDKKTWSNQASCINSRNVKPDTLSSSLMYATWPFAVILIRPDQSGVSSFQSAALQTQVNANNFRAATCN